MIEPSKEKIRISDHAVLRYLERAMDLNIEVVRDHIASICAAPAAFGANCVRAEGLRFEIAKNTVTTIMLDNQRHSAISQSRSAAKFSNRSVSA